MALYVYLIWIYRIYLLLICIYAKTVAIHEDSKLFYIWKIKDLKIVELQAQKESSAKIFL